MDKALDNTDIRNPKEISAKDLAKAHPYSSEAISKNPKYTCTICNEPVQFIFSNTVKSHFRHLHDCSDVAKECDNYAFNTCTYQYSISQRLTGNPLYIQKIGDEFGLFMGLPKLNSDIHSLERKKNQIIKIFNKLGAPIYEINLDNITIDEINRIPLSHLSDKYILKYQTDSQRLKSLWRTETPGITYSGALFYYSDQYARRISIGGEIACNTDYYLVTHLNERDLEKKYLKIQDTARLNLVALNLQKWYVHKIQFIELSNDAWNFARLLKLKLVAKPSKLVSLWPPNVQYGNEMIFKNSPYAYFLLKTTNSNHYLSCYYPNNEIVKDVEKISISNGYKLKIPLSNTKITIKLEEKGTMFDTEISKQDKRDFATHILPTIELKYEDELISNNNTQLIWNKTSILTYNSDCKCDINIFNKSGLLKVIQNSIYELFLDSDLKPGINIKIRHGLDTIYCIELSKLKQDSKNVSDIDEKIYNRLINTKGTLIIPPTQLKYVLFSLNQYPKTKEYLHDALKNQKIFKVACDYILYTFSKGNF